MKMFKKFVTTTVTALALLAGGNGAVTTPAPAEAAVATSWTTPRVTVKIARKMRCRIVQRNVTFGGPENWGVDCIRRGQEYGVRKYVSARQGKRFWKRWIDEGYYARKGKVFVIPQGDEPYSRKAARYAARRIGGRVVKA